MWRRSALVVAIACVGHAAWTSAEERAAGDLIASTGWVRFQITFGRIQVSPRCPQLKEARRHGDPSSGQGQECFVCASEGSTRVRFERQSGGELLTFHVDERGLRLRHRSPQQRVVCFSQPAEGRLQLTVHHDDRVQTWQADNLWCLLLAQPAASRQYLQPLLARLRPDWDFDRQRALLRGELLRLADGPLLTSQDVAELVDKLDSDRYRRRLRAERELAALGPGVLWHLERLRPRTLDAEQRLRLGAVRRQLQGRTADRCERVAAWLAPSPQAWLALMNDPDPQCRRRAFQELCEVCGGQLDFNPQAGADQRAQQIARLESSLRE